MSDSRVDQTVVRQGVGREAAFVGRQGELGAVLDVVSDGPALVVIDGEAGMGKSRLVRRLLEDRQLRGRRVLIGHCHHLREPFSFGPMVEALGGLADDSPSLRGLTAVAGALRPLLPELAGQLPPALEPLGDSRAERHRIFRAVHAVLEAVGPCVCVLEDLHWADEGTFELLRFLTVRAPEHVSFLVTCREGDPAARRTLQGVVRQLPSRVRRLEVTLGPMPVSEVGQLVAGVLDTDDVSADFARFVHERTSGIPFAVEETIRLLAERHDVVRRDGVWMRRAFERLEVPAGVRDAVLERLEGLSADAQQVVRAAAVAGMPMPDRMLGEAAGVSTLEAAHALGEALAAAILVESDGGRIEFRHALAQQAVYEMTPGPHRRRLHEGVARVLEDTNAGRFVGVLARHYRLAGRTTEWLRCAERGADKALAQHDEAAAAKLIEPAVLAAQLSDQARGLMALKLGRTASSGVRATEAAPILRQVLEDGSVPPDVRGQIRLYLGLVLTDYTDDSSAGFAEIARAVPELADQPAMAARAMSALAMPVSLSGHIAEHLRWLELAVQTAAGTDDPSLRLAVAADQATALAHVGDPDAWTVAERLTAGEHSPEDRRQLLRGYCNLAYAACWGGHYERAESYLAAARQRAAGASYPIAEGALEANALLLDWCIGRWEGLEERARRLDDQLNDVPGVIAETNLVGGMARLRHGDLRRAEAQLLAAREAATHAQALPELAAVAGGMVRIHLARANPSRAAEQATKSLKLLRDKGLWIWGAEVVPAAVEALLALGREDAAADLAAEYHSGVLGTDAPAAEAAMNVVDGLLAEAGGDLRRAQQSFRDAQACWARCPRPYEAARAQVAHGRAALAASADHGRGEVLAAIEVLQRLEAPWDAAQARKALRAHGIAVSAKTGRKGYGGELSPREAEVARHAATGLSNREIAAVLMISSRTVEQHVARAMQKQGATSRHALTVHDIDAEKDT